MPNRMGQKEKEIAIKIKKKRETVFVCIQVRKILVETIDFVIVEFIFPLSFDGSNTNRSSSRSLFDGHTL